MWWSVIAYESHAINCTVVCTRLALAFRCSSSDLHSLSAAEDMKNATRANRSNNIRRTYIIQTQTIKEHWTARHVLTQGSGCRAHAFLNFPIIHSRCKGAPRTSDRFREVQGPKHIPKNLTLRTTSTIL